MQSLNLSPRSHKLCLQTTQGDRLLPPNDSPGWRMVDWRPIIFPAQGRVGQPAVGVATAVVWVHAVCANCRELVIPKDPVNHILDTMVGPEVICGDCWTRAHRQDLASYHEWVKAEVKPALSSETEEELRRIAAGT